MIRARAVVVGTLLAAGAAAAAAQQGRSPGITLPVILSIEDARAPTRSDLDVLLAATRSSLRDPAIRALGRLQRRDVITDLLPFLAARETRATAATALALALKGPALDSVPVGQQERAVLDALIAAGESEMLANEPSGLTAIATAVGRIPHSEVDSYKAAETFLRKVLEKPFPKVEDAPHVGAARGLESLVRLHRKLATLDDDTIDRLREVAATTNPRRVEHQRNALAALVSTQGVDADTLQIVLKAPHPEVRRLAVLALAGSGSAIEDEDRLRFIRLALADTSFMVRLEAVRAWARRGAAENGCQPLVYALRDNSLHVVLAAIDALGDICRDDANVTDVLAYEARTPPPQGRWQREAHAFVSLAKRDRGRAAPGMMTFATHPTWQVRMYAARAAAITGDSAILARLAADSENNVAEAALVPLRRLIGADSDRLFIEALQRQSKRGVGGGSNRPYAIIRTAALALENAEPAAPLLAALTGALERISAEQCETSRDTRLALIARIGQLGSESQVQALMPLLNDIDPAVGEAAAAVIAQLTGRPAQAEAPAKRSANIPAESDLLTPVRVSFQMDNGRRFDVQPNAVGPLTRTRFLAAVRSGYYDGLTFHRVVPNFVIQGGSPGANEYCGDCPFMRDEAGGMHRRGTVGISTRGADTGDAQIFINLIDNARLDYDYTVFASVCSGMDVVDEIQEGDRIVRALILPPTPTCGG
ncbi:MAG TPA: peptidylprolyl isomerase [Vicinamibacterales bacterium]|nr:peptidylprolyl isomerase [Vicinamibacterales bacterium]